MGNDMASKSSGLHGTARASLESRTSVADVGACACGVGASGAADAGDSGVTVESLLGATVGEGAGAGIGAGIIAISTASHADLILSNLGQAVHIQSANAAAFAFARISSTSGDNDCVFPVWSNKELQGVSCLHFWA
mmetsp:Transcript_16736/g.20120  ORF Transcript_16736/g.20120 Transcript_16736/m.20120 type:complete len:136 (+) Transcript_16736:312-719(+)